MRLFIWITALILPATAFAQYQIIAGTPEDGQPAIGACGTPLPLDQSRRVTGVRLVCGGARINLPMRTFHRSDKWDEWSLIERSGGGTTESRMEMQALRMQEAPVSYTGEAKYKTYETWNYSIRKRGANPNKCRTWQHPYACKKSRQEAVQEYRCHARPKVEEPSSNYVPVPIVPNYGSNNNSNRGGGGAISPPKRDSWDGGGSYQRRNDGPPSGSRMDSGRIKTIEDYNRSGTSRSGSFPGSSSSGSSIRSGGGSGGSSYRPSSGGSSGSSRGSSGGSSGGSRGSSGSNRRSSLDKIQDIFTSRALAAEGEDCGYEITGYRTVYEDATCYQTMVDTCEWEEMQTGQRECSTETLKYNVSFAKPNTYDPNWKPGQKGSGYHDLLPNKYDLLPGEWEKYTLTINAGRQDEIYGMGLSTSIHPKLTFENQWNEYQVRFNQDEFACRKGANIEVKADVFTQHRIVRKAPNALIPAVDGQNRDRSLERGQFFLPNGHVSLLRPIKIHVIDASNETMMVASRQSRQFKDLDSNAIVTDAKEDRPVKQATAQDVGFLKNTLLKVKLIEKGNCFGENDKVFSDVLDTSSALTKGAKDNLYVPLDGTDPSVESFYKPLGVVGKVLSYLPGKPLDLQLNPGREYEFHVSMQQQGLPFYENGCKNGAKTCDQNDVNPAMYSEELVIKFVADDQYDQRSFLQRFESWYSRRPWNKFRSCGAK